MAFISIHRYLVPYTREIHPEARLAFCLRRIDSHFLS